MVAGLFALAAIFTVRASYSNSSIKAISDRLGLDKIKTAGQARTFALEILAHASHQEGEILRTLMDHRRNWHPAAPGLLEQVAKRRRLQELQACILADDKDHCEASKEVDCVQCMWKSYNPRNVSQGYCQPSSCTDYDSETACCDNDLGFKAGCVWVEEACAPAVCRRVEGYGDPASKKARCQQLQGCEYLTDCGGCQLEGTTCTCDKKYPSCYEPGMRDSLEDSLQRLVELMMCPPMQCMLCLQGNLFIGESNGTTSAVSFEDKMQLCTGQCQGIVDCEAEYSCLQRGIGPGSGSEIDPEVDCPVGPTTCATEAWKPPSTATTTTLGPDIDLCEAICASQLDQCPSTCGADMDLGKCEAGRLDNCRGVLAFRADMDSECPGATKDGEAASAMAESCNIDGCSKWLESVTDEQVDGLEVGMQACQSQFANLSWFPGMMKMMIAQVSMKCGFEDKLQLSDPDVSTCSGFMMVVSRVFVSCPELEIAQEETCGSAGGDSNMWKGLCVDGKARRSVDSCKTAKCEKALMPFTSQSSRMMFTKVFQNCSEQMRTSASVPESLQQLEAWVAVVALQCGVRSGYNASSVKKKVAQIKGALKIRFSGDVTYEQLQSPKLVGRVKQSLLMKLPGVQEDWLDVLLSKVAAGRRLATDVDVAYTINVPDDQAEVTAAEVKATITAISPEELTTAINKEVAADTELKAAVGTAEVGEKTEPVITEDVVVDTIEDTVSTSVPATSVPATSVPDTFKPEASLAASLFFGLVAGMCAFVFVQVVQ